MGRYLFPVEAYQSAANGVKAPFTSSSKCLGFIRGFNVIKLTKKLVFSIASDTEAESKEPSQKMISSTSESRYGYIVDFIADQATFT